jgi:Dolichyl-phosphate-mannose-protein mannosyltransferase
MPVTSEPRRPRADLVLFAGALLVLAVVLARQIAVAAPFGHDEAIYAGGGRELIAGTDASGYRLHRSIGMKVVAAAGLLIEHPGEWAPRALVLLAGLGFLIAYRAVGARALGRWPAAWAAAAMVTSFGFQRRGAEILSDVPSLLLLMLVVLVILREVGGRAEGGRPGPWLLAIAPIAAAAFYLRYGLAGSLVAVGLAAASVWWRPLVAGRRAALATLALFALLLLPHVVHSVRETGSPVGILMVSGDAAHRDYLGQGLVQFPLALALEGGPLLAALVVLGAVHGARVLRRLRLQRRHARPSTEDRMIAFLWLASALQIFVTGLLAHAEFRYFFFGVAGLALVGAAAACRWAEGRGRVVGAVAAAALFAAMLVTHLVNMRRYERLARVREVHVAAAAAVRRASGEGSCAALTSEVPVIGWYSGCSARNLATRPERLPAGRRFLVLFEREKGGAAARARLARSHRLTEVGRAADPAGFYGGATILEIH